MCGKVRYVVNEALISADHCHCSMCRRQHGAAFATYADIQPGSLKWLAGSELVKVYQAPTGGGWCFCAECGSTLAGTAAGEITSIALGTIDGDPGIRPACHIFTASKANWYDIQDDLPQYSERSN